MTAEETLGPELSAWILNTHTIVNVGMRSDDVVFRWLSQQWEASIQALPQIPSTDKHMTRRLINHMGGIALTFERLRIPGYENFINAAGSILRTHIALFGEEPKPAPSPTHSGSESFH